jgi:hypothetical protein
MRFLKANLVIWIADSRDSRMHADSNSREHDRRQTDSTRYSHDEPAGATGGVDDRREGIVPVLAAQE